MYNTYIVSFSPFMTDPTPRRILEYVKSHSYTYQYLVPFAGTILIKSSSQLGEMIGSYSAFMSPNDFLLVQVNPLFVSGLLQPQYWEWLNSTNPPALTGPKS